MAERKHRREQIHRLQHTQQPQYQLRWYHHQYRI